MLLLLPVLLFAACSQQGGYYGQRGRIEYGAEGWRAPTRYYPPPGPPEDPWGPYIREAAGRFNVPGHWVRAVMHQESGGEQQAVSSAGAMGLMQVMPATYEGLRVRYGLGDDPYDPHNNILAGTAYMREMYDRFGSPGFLAAYNAGPDRVEAYLAGRSALPDETVNYVAAITPNLGTDVPRSGPFAVYASARSGRAQRPTVASLAAGCDLNAAYNPNYPCSSLQRAAREPAPVQTAFAHTAGRQWLRPECGLRPCASLHIGARHAGSHIGLGRRHHRDGGQSHPGVANDGSAAAKICAATAATKPIFRAWWRTSNAISGVRRGMGDPGGGIQKSGPGPLDGRGRTCSGAGSASFRRARGATDGTLWQCRALSRSPRGSVGRLRIERLHASQPASAALRRRPAKHLLSARR